MAKKISFICDGCGKETTDTTDWMKFKFEQAFAYGDSPDIYLEPPASGNSTIKIEHDKSRWCSLDCFVTWVKQESGE